MSLTQQTTSEQRHSSWCPPYAAGGIPVDYDMLGRALRKQFNDASNKGAEFVVIVAPNEIETGQVILKSMKDGSENKYYANSLKETLSKMVKA